MLLLIVLVVVPLEINGSLLSPSRHSYHLFFNQFSGFQFDTEDGDKVLPDFIDSIIGIKRSETRSFPYVFPDSWIQEDLRGVRAQFTVSHFL